MTGMPTIVPLLPAAMERNRRKAVEIGNEAKAILDNVLNIVKTEG